MQKVYKIAIAISVWLTTKYKDNPILVIAITTVSIILVILELHNGIFDAISKYKEEKIFKVQTAVKAPIFINNITKDSVNIIVARFENYYNPNISNCIGNAIAKRINQVTYSKQLPINVIYNDSLLSPQTVKEAKDIAQANNSDLIIYGLFKNSNNQCGDGKVCFRTTANSFLKTSADSSNINLEKYDLDFKDIKSGQIELGQFSLDTVAFDYWIESLVILKRNKNYFSGFRSLYKIPDNISLIDKYERYNKRGIMNAKLGLYYKAISDYDTAISTCKKRIIIKQIEISRIPQDFNDPKDKGLPAPLRRMLLISLDIVKDKNILFNLFYNKTTCLAMIGKYDLAQTLINKELEKIQNIRKNVAASEKNQSKILLQKPLKGKNILSFSLKDSTKGEVQVNMEDVENEIYFLKSHLYFLANKPDSMYKYIPYARGVRDCEKYYAYFIAGAFAIEKNYEKTLAIIEDAKRTGCKIYNPNSIKNDCLIMLKYNWYIKNINLLAFILFTFWLISLFTLRKIFLYSYQNTLKKGFQYIQDAKR
ncbi:hypothetical protein [Spirosoma flavum]|uniref:Uncharacterized protein n=1 Tax=Spirosoma flavum TaxID=2048557 RepID=A0ABW6AUI3_9BACT